MKKKISYGGEETVTNKKTIVNYRTRKSET